MTIRLRASLFNCSRHFSLPRRCARSLETLSFATLSLAILPLVGCVAGLSHPASAPPTTASAAIKLVGSVHGGQQPIAGAQIALYAAGKTGTASVARAMLSAPVATDAHGDFSLSGLYSCQAGDQVYVVATGGDPGAGPNPASAMMTALGPCDTLLANAATTFITINEVTTAASVSVLAPFMSGAQNIGSDPARANALAAAFASFKTLADSATGLALETSTGNGIVPRTTVNSLANSLAACVNSAPAATACTSLFSATSSAGSTPADTLQAALQIALHPAQNPSQVFAVAGSDPPFQPTLAAAPGSYALVVAHSSDVLTYHNDNARSGAQSHESLLTPTNVNSAQFGRRFVFPVDASLFAQPLYAGGIGMPDGAVHNLVFASTSHGTVYAFDADGANPAAGYLWKRSLVPAGEQAPVGSDYGGCPNPPEAGIIGTPVIDRASQTLYVVVKTRTSVGATFFQRLHALSLVDGSEQPNSPGLINPTFAGTGDGSLSGSIAFNPQRQLNRAALLLTPGAGGGSTVWIAYASHCDINPYHGLVLGYNAANVTQLTAAFNDTPNGNEGGIWMAGGGLAADAQGSIYASAGNGTFDVDSGGTDYGDSFLKLAAPAPGAATNVMSVADYFTPSNQAFLQQRDLDIGGTESLLIDDPASGVAPHLLFGTDKNTTFYLINTASMGRFNTGVHGVDGRNGDVQDFTAGGTPIWNFAFHNNVLYSSNPIAAYAFVPGTASTAGHLNPTPLAQIGVNNSAPALSANGTSNAMLWQIDGNSILHAYTAPALSEVYNTAQAPNGRDTPSTVLKFIAPVIANGKVYVGGTDALVVFGPLP